ncbi:MAG: nickel pincer cofactor biosynthesis protein LarC [Gemmatimonadota bacterium]|nr:nickel pincer cofactor biosynthesis protein LarC [Gemmatimonadota bacterium]
MTGSGPPAAGRVAHFDASTGAAGDMILAALLDAGAPLDKIRAALATLPVDGVELAVAEDRRGGIRGLRVSVATPPDPPRRHLDDIIRILRAGDLPGEAEEAAAEVFRRLATAEGCVHGISATQVHFHEVGAVDAIVDIAGVALALHFLGVREVTHSPLGVGTGTTECEHGTLAVPVPAVAELTRGIPILRTGIRGEILTPTGAAILTTLGRPAEPGVFLPDAVGTGCGTREIEGHPNVLRVTLGTRGAVDSLPSPDATLEEDTVVLLSTNLDDMSPEALPSVLENLLAHGALDAYLTPVLMKKGRPGHLLTVACPPEKAEDLARRIFRETSTFGIRRSVLPRWKLVRESRELSSPWGPIRIKLGSLPGGELRVTPEYESCRAISDQTGMPLLEVFREVENLIQETEWTPPAGANG